MTAVPKLVASVLPADFAELGPATIGAAAATGADVFCAGSAPFTRSNHITMTERTAALRATVFETNGRLIPQ